MRTLHQILSALCGSASLLAASSALAQDRTPAENVSIEEQAGGGFDDIIVTARRKEESLQNVPVAVSAISSEQIQTQLATDLLKIAELAPQVIIGKNGSGTGAFITIRGISSFASDAGLDQSVLVTMDQVPLSRGRIITAAMFDLAQVEVLAGPQALFFGKNSPAGVISLTSANPTDRFEGYVRAGYEFNAREKYVEAAVSGPLSDTLGARLAFRGNFMDGWIKNVAVPQIDPLNPAVTIPGALQGDRQPNTRDIAGRLTLTWQPSDRFDANLKILYNRQDVNSMTPNVEAFCAEGRTQPVLGAIPLAMDCRADQVVAQAAVPAIYAANFPYANGGIPYQTTDLWFGALTWNYDFSDQFGITSTTGYYNQSLKGLSSGYSPIADTIFTTYERYKLWTQELRFQTKFDGPINLMGGAYYESSRRYSDYASYVLHRGIDPATNSYADRITVSDTHSSTYSFFGQVSWRITDALELTGGARYSHDDKHAVYYNSAVSPFSTVTGLRTPGVPLRPGFKGNNVSPEVTLTWRPENGQMVYASYKTGYKAGGLSNSVLLYNSTTESEVVLQPEKARGFEIGYKGTLFDNRLRLNLTAYHYKYLGLQLGSFDSVLNAFRIQNAAAARIRGIQADFQWRASDALNFNGNVGWNSAVYTDYTGAQCFAGQTVAEGCVTVGTTRSQNLTGKPLQRAPDITFTLGTDYTIPVGNDLRAMLSFSASYSSSYHTASDYSPGSLQEAFWRLNAGVRFGPEDEKWELAVLGRNLTDSYVKFATFGFPSAGVRDQFIGQFGRPREVAVQASVKF